MINPNLVNKSKIIIPPLYVKLGLNKQFIKALPKNGPAFLYLFEKFPHYSPAKIGEGICIGPDIRKLARDKAFSNIMTEPEQQAWNTFLKVFYSFFEKPHDDNIEHLSLVVTCL